MRSPARALVLLLAVLTTGFLPGAPAAAPVLSPAWDAESPGLPAAAGLILSRLVPRTDRSGSEAFAVANAGPGPASLDGVAVRDGEGVLRFPAVALAAGEELWVASDPPHLAEVAGLQAAFGWRPGASAGAAPMLAEEGSFVLSNDGEGVWLEGPAGVLDAVVYGRETEPDAALRREWRGDPLGWAVRSGEVLTRRHVEGSLVDSDGPWDWRTPRRHLLGQTQLAPFAFEAANLTPLLFPGDGADRIRKEIGTAATRVVVSSYQLTQPALLETLAAGARAGVEVRVFLESAPAGETAEEAEAGETWSAFLKDAGAAVDTDDGRYVFRHGKFGAVDGSRFWVVSENLRSEGQTTRGWGLLADSRPAALWLEALAADGAARQDGFPRSAGGGNALLLAAPDHTVPGAGPTPLLDLLASAGESIVVEALDLPLAWEPLPWGGQAANPLVEALAAAAARDVRVRVLLSATFAEPGEGNHETALLLDGLRAAGLPVDVRLHATGDGGRSLLHNKAFVVDGRWSVVGSLNGGLHSAASNREVLIALDDRDVAAAFTAAFDADFASATGRPAGRAAVGGGLGLGDPASVGLVAILICTGLLLVAIRRRR